MHLLIFIISRLLMISKSELTEEWFWRLADLLMSLSYLSMSIVIISGWAFLLSNCSYASTLNYHSFSERWTQAEIIVSTPYKKCFYFCWYLDRSILSPRTLPGLVFPCFWFKFLIISQYCFCTMWPWDLYSILLCMRIINLPKVHHTLPGNHCRNYLCRPIHCSRCKCHTRIFYPYYTPPNNAQISLLCLASIFHIHSWGLAWNLLCNGYHQPRYIRQCLLEAHLHIALYKDLRFQIFTCQIHASARFWMCHDKCFLNYW